MSMQKIIILDFETAEVHVFDYDYAVYEGFEEFYEAVNEEFGYSFSDSNCQCMIADKREINIH